MFKLTRFIIISLLPFMAVLLILLFISTTTLDFKYAHKSLSNYQNSFNWALYKIEINLLKFIKNLKNNKKKGLNKKKIYIAEKSQKALLQNIPMSTKIWQQGFLLGNDDKLKKIKIRYRGDNPRNWLFQKKNLRIKTRKKDQLGQFRYYDYHPYNVKKFVSGRIANKTGVNSQKYDLIELYINDISEGIYIQTEKINENFLRRNKIMPVNIYKGEQINSEGIVRTNENLFNNPLLWKKIAIFNKKDNNDKEDVKNFLNLLRKSETDVASYDKLMKMIDLTEWAKFAAYQILTDNYHNDSSHNMRMIFDPWSGLLRPIIYDPVIGDKIFNNNEIDFNNSSHDLFLFLNKNSLFIDQKYKELFNYIYKNKLIETVISELELLEKEISISETRDIELQRYVLSNFDLIKKINPINFLNLTNKNERALVVKKMLLYNKKLAKILISKPKSSWSYSKNGFIIKVNDNLPISNIKVFFKKDIPKFISIDLNNDKNLTKNEKFTPDQDGVFNIPLTLYANRNVVAKNKNDLRHPNIITSNTSFEFQIDELNKPHKIEVQNPFFNERFDLQNDNSKSIPFNKFNLPVINFQHNSDKLISLKGTISVNKNLVFKDEVIIKPGTQFLLEKGVSVIFLNTVTAIGTEENPIIFKKKDINDFSSNWGSIILQGINTKNSKFKHVIIDGGSGAEIDQYIYTSMFSLHDTKNVILENIILVNNKIFDDSLHLIYCENILLNKIIIIDAFSDALDIDISDKIVVKNSRFINPKNDSIDIMESKVLIDNTEIYLSGDKGISVGENSKVSIHNTHLFKNNIGLAVKDNSKTNAIYSDFDNNQLQVSSFQKNYKYGNGGNINIIKSNFNSNFNKIQSDKKSIIRISDSSFNKPINIKNSNIEFDNKIDFNSNKQTEIDVNLLSIDTMFTNVNSVKNLNLRGSDFTNK
jgi:hypothetical protein